jgi:hypothetical protein
MNRKVTTLQFILGVSAGALELETFLCLRCVCVCDWILCGSVADTTGSRRTLLTMSISHGQSQFKVHTDGLTQVPSVQPSLAVTHPSINRGRRALNSVNEPLSYSLGRHRTPLCLG